MLNRAARYVYYGIFFAIFKVICFLILNNTASQKNTLKISAAHWTRATAVSHRDNEFGTEKQVSHSFQIHHEQFLHCRSFDPTARRICAGAPA